MKQKPIKRNPHIQPLSRDHHFTLLFCWKIRQGIRRGAGLQRMTKYVHYFWTAHMQAHFREEEHILFIPDNDSLVNRAMDEHRNIEKLVNAIISSTPSEATLADLADAVDAHVRYEERELFPHLERVLSEEQLQSIGHALEKEEKATEEYPDKFWV